MASDPCPHSRRDWLRRAGVAAASLALTPGALSALPHVADADLAPPMDHTPDTALQALVEGNRRFSAGKVSNPNRTLARLRELGTKQVPFAAVLGCADSRVPVEILFDQGFGDLFVTRIAGNIATSEAIGSLEYGASVLGARLVLVLGHSACGAVAATMKAETVPGQIGSLYPYIHPAVQSTQGKGVDAVVRENVRNQVQILQKASPVLADLGREKKVRVVGGIFDFRTGLVTML